MKIGYLGPAGSYSHEAACRCQTEFSELLEPVACAAFSAIVAGVEDGSLDYGIIPVENSTHGAVASVLDLLVNIQNCTVCGEVVLNIEHCLLSASTNPTDIKYVFSHEQALEQCRNFFRTRYPWMELIHCASTSQACELAQKNGPSYGAVAGFRAAGLYDLKIAAETIQDNQFNQTRFLLLGTREPASSGQDKTSIVFAFDDDCPGNLYGVLKAFAEHRVNLTRIESRPAKHIMGKYIFHIDFSGHRQDVGGDKALAEIRRQVNWLKVLGSYPAAKPVSPEGKGD